MSNNIITPNFGAVNGGEAVADRNAFTDKEELALLQLALEFPDTWRVSSYSKNKGNPSCFYIQDDSPSIESYIALIIKERANGKPAQYHVQFNQAKSAHCPMPHVSTQNFSEVLTQLKRHMNEGPKHSGSDFDDGGKIVRVM